MKDLGFTEPPQAMKEFPQCMVLNDSISAYKNFYREAKKSFATWKSKVNAGLYQSAQ